MFVLKPLDSDRHKTKTWNVCDVAKLQVHRCTLRQPVKDVQAMLVARSILRRLVTSPIKLTGCVNKHTQHRSSYRLNNPN